MCIIEGLLFTLGFWGISILLKMVLSSLVRGKVTKPVRVPGVHKVIFPYISKKKFTFM